MECNHLNNRSVNVVVKHINYLEVWKSIVKIV